MRRIGLAAFVILASACQFAQATPTTLAYDHAELTSVTTPVGSDPDFVAGAVGTVDVTYDPSLFTSIAPGVFSGSSSAFSLKFNLDNITPQFVFKPASVVIARAVEGASDYLHFTGDNFSVNLYDTSSSWFNGTPSSLPTVSMPSSGFSSFVMSFNHAQFFDVNLSPLGAGTFVAHAPEPAVPALMGVVGLVWYGGRLVRKLRKPSQTEA